MAAILPSGSGGNRSHPSSAQVASSAWEYAVSAGNENSMISEPESYNNDEIAQRPAASQLQKPKPFRPTQKRNNTQESQPSSQSNETHVPSYLAPTKPSLLIRKGSDQSGAGSDADSLIDLYKPKTEKGGHSKTVGARKQPEHDDDGSNWIHRDKLAEIESRELHEAGLRLGRKSRSRTRSSSRSLSRPDAHRDGSRSRSGVRQGEEEPSDGDAIRVAKRQRLSTQQEGLEERILQELRSPEDSATELERRNRRTSLQSTKIVTSRIPVSKVAHAPVPSAVLGRDSPLTRSRAGSGALPGSYEDGTMFNKVRSRSQSMGSPISYPAADDGGVQTPPRRSIAQEGSPEAGASPASNLSKSGLAPRVRKATPGSRTVSGQQKVRIGSNTYRDSPVGRPGTSSSSRPGTALSRPEGEAPWIAHMFKPDPRLPQDQQLLPTHAKRLQQEQWQKEGRTGSAYDRNFNLLNDDGFGHSPIEGQSTIGMADKQKDPEWPLSTPRTESPGRRSATSTTDHGGYKTIPSIPTTRRPSPGALQPSQSALSKRSEVRRSPRLKPIQLPREPEVPEKEAKPKKKLACCIVM